MTDNYAAFKEQFFNIAEAQAEPKVQPYGVADNFGRDVVVLVVVGG